MFSPQIELFIIDGSRNANLHNSWQLYLLIALGETTVPHNGQYISCTEVYY